MKPELSGYGFFRDRHSMHKTRVTYLVAAILMSAFAIQAVSSMRQKSVTTDEIMYITAGYYHLRTGEFDYNRTNPPFVKLLTALPLLYLDPELPAIASDPGAWSEVEQWQYAREFLYSNSIDADSILFASRLPVVGLGLFLGWYTFLFAINLYGQRAALIALFLFAFSPNLLAHSRLATQDLALAALGFVAAYYLWRFFERPGWSALFKSATFYALAVATKTSAVFLALPVLVSAAVIVASGRPVLSDKWHLTIFSRFQGKRVREFMYMVAAICVFGFMSLVVINVVYGFEGSFVQAKTYAEANRIIDTIAARAPFLSPILDVFLHLPVPVPEPMIRIAEFQASRVASGNNIYFHGAVSSQGWWYVIPVAFLIKSPIPILLLSLTAIVAVVRAGALRSGEVILILLAGFMFCLFTYLKSVSIGLRYILIVYPCLHVLASGIMRDGVAIRRFQAPIIVVVLAWYAIGTMRVYPNYLPYFNEFVGGPGNGYKYLADSFVDWGQDLPALKAYMDDHDMQEIRLAYFGSADANYYDIGYEYLPSVGLRPSRPDQKWWYEPGADSPGVFDPAGGPIAISVTLLAGIFYPEYYDSLQDLEPVDNIGHSILIFDPNKE